MSPNVSSSARRPVLWLALVCHLALATAYSLRTPAFEGPDENGHGYYAFHLAHRRALPVVEGSSLNFGLSSWDESPVGHHPPLYYSILAATMHVMGGADTVPTFSLAETRTALQWRHGYDEVAPVSSEIALLRVLRGWSVLFGLATIVLTHRLGLIGFPSRPVVADAAALLVACLPQFSFMHGVLDNGNLAATLSHCTLVALALALSRGALTARRGALLGLLAGLALIAKLTTLFLIPVLGIVYLVCLVRWPNRRRETLLSGTLVALVAGVISGWFFVRNIQLYGDPMAHTAMGAISVDHLIPQGIELDFLIQFFAPEVFRSFVGFFGWWTLPAPGVVVAGWGGLFLLAALGWILGWCRGIRPGPQAWVLFLAAVVLFLSVLQFNLSFVAAQGRYLFPTVGPIMILLSAGLMLLVERVAPWLAGAGPGGAWPWRAAVAIPPVAAVLVLQLHFTPVFRMPAPDDPYYATMIADVATPVASGRTVIEVVEPEDGARLEGPPVFRWVPPEDRRDGPFALHLFSPNGRIWLSTEQHGLRLSGGEWTIPGDFWSTLPLGEELLGKLRSLPDRAKGESVEDVPQSATFRVVRVR